MYFHFIISGTEARGNRVFIGRKPWGEKETMEGWEEDNKWDKDNPQGVGPPPPYYAHSNPTWFMLSIEARGPTYQSLHRHPLYTLCVIHPVSAMTLKEKQNQFLGTPYNAQKNISVTNQSQSNFYRWSSLSKLFIVVTGNVFRNPV